MQKFFLDTLLVANFLHIGAGCSFRDVLNRTPNVLIHKLSIVSAGRACQLEDWETSVLELLPTLGSWPINCVEFFTCQMASESR